MKRFYTLLLLVFIFCIANAQNKALVFQSDFGLKDGAVSEMKGVAYGVSPDIKIFDITHEIPAYNIWEAAYRLQQTAPYWPAGTVFVSVVDPGVGSARKSVVLKTKTNQYFVTPDNGTLTLIAQNLGIAAVREIDEKKNRRSGSSESYTFHGRDVYAYTGARLAAGVISFDQVGPLVEGNDTIVKIKYQQPVYNNGTIKGNIPVLDIQYGNVWTNISKTLFSKLNLQYGNMLQVTISHNNKVVYKGSMPYVTTFSAVRPGKPLAYINSLLNISFALNQSNFSSQLKVFSGPGWNVEISK